MSQAVMFPHNETTSLKPPSSMNAHRLGAHREYGFIKITHGYISVILTCCIVPINILMIATFYKGKWRTPAHKILVNIALLESLTGLTNIVPSVYFFTLGYGDEYTPFHWCLPRELLSRIIPSFFRTWSLNLMVLLALQRLLVVKRPFQVGNYFTSKKTITQIGFAGIIALGGNFPPFLSLGDYTAISVMSILQPTETIIGCVRQKSNIINQKVADLLLVVISKIIPILLLAVLDVCLIRTLQRRAHKQTNNLGLHQHQVSHRHKESNRLTLISTVIVCCILTTEMPALICHMYFSYSENISCKRCVLEKLHGILHPIGIIVYSLSFVVYCCLSKRFRRCVGTFCKCQDNSRSKSAISRQTLYSLSSRSTLE